MSVYYDILTALETAVRALNLMLKGSQPAISIRKLPEVQESLDTLPAILICPSDETESIAVASAENQVNVVYRVDLVVVAAGNQDFTSNLDTYLAWREKIRRLVQGTTLPGAPTVWDMNPRTKGSPIDREAVNSNYDYLPLTADITSCEQRSN